MPVPAFASILVGKLSEVAEDLAKECEQFATEREKFLRNENVELRKQNTELRRQLGLDVGQPLDNVGVAPPPPESINAPPPPAPLNELLMQAAHCDGHDNGLETSLDERPSKAAREQTRSESNAADVLNGVISVEEEFKLLPELLIKSDSEELQLAAARDTQSECFEPPEGFSYKTGVSAARGMIVDLAHGFINPSSPPMIMWETLGIPVLFWDIIFIPMGVFELPEGLTNISDNVDWITLSYWTLDLIITFMIGFQDENSNMVYDHKLIAQRYLKGNFWLDFVIVLTDIMQTTLENGFMKNLGVLRILRISRFARLFRLNKFKQKLQALEDLFNNEWYLICVDLICKVLTILVINHYICCGWYFLGTASDLEVSSRRWLSSLPYPQYDSHGEKMTSANFTYKYFTCLHWAIAQFTPGPQNIQPQNSYERAYAISVLLFGMVIFSTFIASVTQARMHMSRMMGNFERDHWLLREFCRQYKISTTLQRRMKRYIDTVVLPARSKLSADEVTFIAKLSFNLREQLDTELWRAKICAHHFFQYLAENNASVLNQTCSHAIENVPLAHGDVVYSGGHVARSMLIVISGHCLYKPIRSVGSVEGPQEVLRGDWVSEAALWTKWIHQGTFESSIESTALRVYAQKFREVLLRGAMVMNIVRQYGTSFCVHLNKKHRERHILSDLQSDFAPKYFGSFGTTKPLKISAEKS